MLPIIIGGGVLLIGYAIAVNQRKKAEATKRKQLFDFIVSKYDAVENAVSEHMDSVSFMSYYSNRKKVMWLAKHKFLYDSIHDKSLLKLGLDVEKFNTINRFKEIYLQLDLLIKEYNDAFLQSELQKFDYLFDNVENRKLDIQQRTAVVKDEDNNLIIAGAGSGKTTTIIGKVNYILEKQLALPEEILLISFTKDSAATLAGRLKVPDVPVKTFHKFGIDVMTDVNVNKLSVYDEKQFGRFIQKSFNELLAEPAFLLKVTNFFIHFLKPVKQNSDFDTIGDHIQFLKDNNYRSYQMSSDKTTYKLEIVKSIQECQIANFLLFNSIEYKYEAQYEFDTATPQHQRWKPDFTLFQDDRRIYLEHFGVDRNGNIPKFFVKADQTYEQARTIYNNKMQWARDTSARYETTLLETYSYEMDEGILFKKLTQNLKDLGVELVPKTASEKWAIIKEAAKDEVNQTFKLAGTFIALLKSNNYRIADIRARNKSTPDKFMRQRNDIIIDIIEPIYNRYQAHLRKEEEIDFSDMINIAAEHISTRKYNRQYKYVIVDEFQDISVSRFQLIKAIKDSNPDCKTFCVGDDWQSIYRFAGSDITLFKEFERYFGFTLKSKIETTYRFKNPLIELSSTFVQRNPFQEKKELKAFNDDAATDYSIIYSITEDQDDTAALKDVFDSIIDQGNQEKKTLLLGRYSFDFKRIKNRDNEFIIDQKNETIGYRYDPTDRQKILSAGFMTVHKSKGLEADTIILLNCNAGKLGFPSQISDDPVLNLLLNESDQFENGEERRLFYVAMTRAKEQLYLITEDRNKSKFILELEGKISNELIQKCPNCITADLVRRSGQKNGKEWAFLGCSNYSYGCDFQKWL